MKKYCSKVFESVRSDSDYIYKPCCHYTGFSNFDSIENYLNSEHLQNLQKHFLTQNTFPIGCQACERCEEAGHVSTRQIFNKISAKPTETKITNIEIFPSNVCNLNCVMCNPGFSTGVAQEYKKLGWIDKVESFDSRYEIVKDLRKLPDLTALSIVGGEFFMIKSCIDILDFACEKQLTVRIISNATVIKQEHIDRLKNLSKLDLTISIDATGEEYEFIRYPASWDVVQNNVRTLRKQLPKSKIHVNAVIQLLNIAVIDQLITWCNKQILPLTLTPIIDKPWLSWEVLNSHEKTNLCGLLNDIILSTKLTKDQQLSLTQYIENIKSSKFDPKTRQLCLQKLQALSSIRQVVLPKSLEKFATLTSEL